MKLIAPDVIDSIAAKNVVSGEERREVTVVFQGHGIVPIQEHSPLASLFV